MDGSQRRGARARRVRDGVARLRRAAGDGTLAAVCGRHGVDLMTLHGSTARGEALPSDIDVGVLFASDEQARRGLLDLLQDLTRLTGTDLVDVMDVRRASPTARARALAHDAEVLFEARPGVATRQQMAALTLEMELAPLRQLQLELLAGP